MGIHGEVRRSNSPVGFSSIHRNSSIHLEMGLGFRDEAFEVHFLYDAMLTHQGCSSVAGKLDRYFAALNKTNKYN